MNKTLLILGIITIALLAYAMKTAKLPAGEFEYEEVFWSDNVSITYLQKDGWGLFGVKIKPYVDGASFEVEFPEDTEYTIKIGEKTFTGKDKFSHKISKDEAKDTVYIRFQLPPELTKKIVYGKGNATIQITLRKVPFWQTEDTIYVVYKKQEK
ncbi:hypothetical protein [Thermococcus barophilus]|uniref:Uncharacterized protein n=1 Tax=Thermococcus barophilus TaxID=55802 RepID=A0A0S1XD90_THEBA|nr:hypothetical protein [Thermococcus barophilus]ALM75754.1 conserved exported hypothetical protein [Thermococcus barophilus]